MEPTYRMEPKVKFNHERAERLVHSILDSRLKWASSRLDGATGFSSEDVDELTLSITDEIRSSVRDLSFERYRLVVLVNVGETAAGIADVRVASRCLWDPRFDTFAEASVLTPLLYAVAVVFAVYCE